jgi:aspartyl-tRNA(Asn)/glutamyl-tRNA(Gln) amidotransferase subunit A
VAAGIAALALGTDGAGSTRGPAACCGLVGLKGTTGALPYQQAREAFANVVAAGPLTRSIADATLMQSILGGAAPEDPWTSEQVAIGRVSDKLISRDLSRLRIGYIERADNKTVAADVQKNTNRALKALAEMGAEIEVVGGDIDWMSEQQRTLYLCSIANNLGHVVDTYGDKTDTVLRAFVEAGRKYDTKSYIHAMNARTRMFRAVQTLFETYDVLISPTLTRGAIDVEFNSAKDDLIIDGELVGPSQPHLTGFMYPFNLTGHPALSVPSGFDSDGLPTGIQIIAARNHDVDTLRIGALLEDALPWAHHWPQI